MRLLLLFFSQLFFVCAIFGQVSYQDKEAHRFSLTTKSTFVVLKDGIAVDKRLSFKEEFNAAGYPVSQTINRDGRKTVYLYEYLNDSIRTQRVTLFNDSVAVTTKIVQEGSRTICRDYDAEGQEMDSYSIDEFTKDGRLKETQIFYKGEMLLHTVYKYYKDGKIKKIKVLVGNKRVIRYDREGNRTSSEVDLCDVLDQSRKNLDKDTVIVSKSERFNRGVAILGIAGELRLKSGDVVKVDSYQNQTGLPLYKIESINGELQSKVIYEYVFRDK
jgi:antitoxin component YwqK of YwqJK toxin-antitoxin module